jgi:hypothetical protein
MSELELPRPWQESAAEVAARRHLERFIGAPRVEPKCTTVDCPRPPLYLIRFPYRGLSLQVLLCEQCHETWEGR